MPATNDEGGTGAAAADESDPDIDMDIDMDIEREMLGSLTRDCCISASSEKFEYIYVRMNYMKLSLSTIYVVNQKLYDFSI